MGGRLFLRAGTAFSGNTHTPWGQLFWQGLLFWEVSEKGKCAVCVCFLQKATQRFSLLDSWDCGLEPAAAVAGQGGAGKARLGEVQPDLRREWETTALPSNGLAWTETPLARPCSALFSSVQQSAQPGHCQPGHRRQPSFITTLAPTIPPPPPKTIQQDIE